MNVHRFSSAQSYLASRLADNPKALESALITLEHLNQQALEIMGVDDDSDVAPVWGEKELDEVVEEVIEETEVEAI